MTLTEALGETGKKSAGRIPEEKRKVMTSAIEALRNSHIEEGVLKVGDKAPLFQLPDASGKTVSLSDVLKKGPVVIVFYRGGWCPYCNLNLQYLQRKLKDIQAQGASLIAISPETPDNSLSTKEKNELKFDVLSDKGNKIARQLGLVFTLPAELVSVYKEFGIDLEKSNGDTAQELPLAATFVLDGQGKVVERFVDVDYKKRMDPEDILKVLKRIKSGD